MRVIIENNKEAVGKWTANYIYKRILKFKPTSKQPFVLGLPTGSTPLETYKYLIELFKEGKLSFQNVVTFNMDEYVGLPEDHEQSYHTFMKKNFFDHIDIKPENTNIPNGNAEDVIKESREYEKKIQSYGGIHLFLVGCGVNAHLGFSEAGSSLSSRTRLKTLANETIIANSRFFEYDLSKVPMTAITVGVQTVLDAQEVILIATGFNKAFAISKIIDSGINHMYVCTALQQHPHAIIVC